MDPLSLKTSINLAETWILPVFIGLLCLFAWIKNSYPRKWIFLIKSSFQLTLPRQLLVEESYLLSQPSTSLLALFALSGGLMLYQADVFFEWELINTDGPVLWLTYSLLLLVVYAVKYLAVKWVELLFEEHKAAPEYISSVFLLLMSKGVTLLPLAIFVTYVDRRYAQSIFFIALAFWIAIFLFQLVKGVWLAVQQKISKVYLFLYLCTLEIFPILVLYQYFGKNS